MTPIECGFEEEVLAAAMQSRWPDRVNSELREHVASCAICRELASVAGAISDAKDEMRATVSVPDSSRVWWTAQLRARREALAAAGRPITAAHLIAFACAAGIAGACFGATSAWFQSVLKWIASSASFVPSATSFLAGHWALVAGMALVLFLVPAAVYLAMGRD